MLDNPDDFVIIDGVIGLAEAFHRETIAEGVETTEHGLMLMRIGCDRAQGYVSHDQWLQINLRNG